MVVNEGERIYATIDLKALALNLPREARIKLHEALANSLGYDTELNYERRRTRVEVLRGYLERIMGYPRIDLKSRKKEYVVAKALICHELVRFEGYSKVHVAQTLEMHHTSVMYLCEQAAVWLDYEQAYRYENKIWNELKRIIDDERENINE